MPPGSSSCLKCGMIARWIMMLDIASVRMPSRPYPTSILTLRSPGATISSAPLSSPFRSEEHTSELQSLMRNSYAVFCLKKKKIHKNTNTDQYQNHQNDTNTHQTQI